MLLTRTSPAPGGNITEIETFLRTTFSGFANLTSTINTTTFITLPNPSGVWHDYWYFYGHFDIEL